MGRGLNWMGWAVFLILFPLQAAQAFTLTYSSALQGWQGSTLTFKVNSSACGMSQAALYQAIDQAIDLWNGVPTSRIKLARGEEVTTTAAAALAGSAASGLPTPLIVCDSSMQTTFRNGVSPNVAADPSFNSNNIPAVTVPIPTELTLDYAVLVLNSESSKAARISNLDSTTLAVVMAHEMGHVLGLGHTQDPSNLMYFDATERSKLSLSQDDMDGVTYLYPRGEIGDNGVFGCGSLAVLRSRGGPPGSGGAAALTEFGMLLAFAAGATWLYKQRAYKQRKTWRMA